MNKYQVVLNWFVDLLRRDVVAKQNAKILQELVDKETPMKPGQDETGTYVCGRCKEYSVTSEGNYSREYERCTMANCGQVVDWSDIE